MMIYKNTKTLVNSPDGNSDFFDIVTGVLQGDTLTPFLFIIYVDFVLQTLIDLIKENDSTLKKIRSKWYPTKTIMDADYVDDLLLLANIPVQIKAPLHSLEWAAGPLCELRWYRIQMF